MKATVAELANLVGEAQRSSAYEQAADSQRVRVNRPNRVQARSSMPRSSNCWEFKQCGREAGRTK